MGWNKKPLELKKLSWERSVSRGEASGCPKGQIYLSANMLLGDDDTQAVMLPFHLALLTHSQQHKALAWDFPVIHSHNQICETDLLSNWIRHVPGAASMSLHKQWNPKIAFQHSLIKTSIKQHQGLPEPPDPSYCLGISLDTWQSAGIAVTMHLGVEF